MSLEMLEQRCQRFIDLMRQASTAIDQQDAIILEAVSRSSERLLEQIERAWHLAMAGPELAVGGEDGDAWKRLRCLMRVAVDQSAENQQKLYSWVQRNRPVRPILGDVRNVSCFPGVEHGRTTTFPLVTTLAGSGRVPSDLEAS